MRDLPEGDIKSGLDAGYRDRKEDLSA